MTASLRGNDPTPAASHESGTVESRFSPGKHIPAIDGLRGLAVVMVVIFHAFQVEAVPAGAIPRMLYMGTRLGQTGVDLFFVLSGFLITGILVDAKGSPRYFINFYGRRTVRIFPLYYSVLIAVLLILPALFGVRLSGNVAPAWLWTYTANVPLSFGGDGGAIAHFWTLAIEEQFYLVWPAVVFFASRRALFKICVGGILGALIARIVAEAVGASSSTFTLCRVDSLTTGGLLALLLRGPLKLVDARRYALAVCLALPLAAAPLYLLNSGHGSHWVQVVKFTLHAALFGALLVLAVTSSVDTTIGRIFNSATLRMVGKYSYGIYVYQAFVIHTSVSMLTTDRLRLLGITDAGAVWVRVTTILLVSYLAAWISWHAMEKHFIRLKRYFGTVDRRASGEPSPSRLRPGPRRGRARVSIRAASS